LRREAHRLANLCYALEGKGILKRPRRPMRTSFVVRQLKQRNSKFVRCYGRSRPPRYQSGWQTLKSVWAETPDIEKPAFKVYRFRKGAWPEMILQAVMRARATLKLARMSQLTSQFGLGRTAAMLARSSVCRCKAMVLLPMWMRMPSARQRMAAVRIDRVRLEPSARGYKL
jgi:hypothetical protein